MPKNQIHSSMIGRTIKLVEKEGWSPGGEPWKSHAGQYGEVVNVFMTDGMPTYTLLFQNGSMKDLVMTDIAKDYVCVWSLDHGNS